MNKPTKEDVVIEEIVQELSSYRGIRQALCDIDDADFENDIIPALKKILISHYSDGGDDRKFIDHIQSHLKPGEIVVCKICGKSADEIIGG